MGAFGKSAFPEETAARLAALDARHVRACVLKGGFPGGQWMGADGRPWRHQRASLPPPGEAPQAQGASGAAAALPALAPTRSDAAAPESPPPPALGAEISRGAEVGGKRRPAPELGACLEALRGGHGTATQVALRMDRSEYYARELLKASKALGLVRMTALVRRRGRGGTRLTWSLTDAGRRALPDA